MIHSPPTCFFVVFFCLFLSFFLSFFGFCCCCFVWFLSGNQLVCTTFTFQARISLQQLSELKRLWTSVIPVQIACELVFLIDSYTMPRQHSQLTALRLPWVKCIWACLFLICCLHFWQSGRGLSHGCNTEQERTSNICKNRKLTLEKNDYRLLLPRIEPATFRLRVRHSQ